MKETEFRVDIERLEGYDFKISFRDIEETLLMSEPAPLGSGKHPFGGHAIAAAIGHCMCSALIFCLEKARVNTGLIKAVLFTKVERNEKGRLRLTKVRVSVHAQVDDMEKARRCMEIFEDYCIVTQSIRQGIEVETEVIPSEL